MAPASNVFEEDTYLIRRKIFAFLGQKFYIYDGRQRLVGFVKQKAFKLKEDIRVYSDDTCRDEILVIKARQIVDFSAAYDIVDPREDEHVGALRRKGLMSSFVRDSWVILDADDNEYGTVEEDSTALAMIRRYFLNIIPQGFTMKADGLVLATFQQNWNFFVPKLTVRFEGPPDEIDRRVGLGAAVLMCAIEGRQKG